MSSTEQLAVQSPACHVLAFDQCPATSTTGMSLEAFPEQIRLSDLTLHRQASGLGVTPPLGGTSLQLTTVSVGASGSCPLNTAPLSGFCVGSGGAGVQ